MTLKNIALIALLFGSATVIHHVNAMEDGTPLESHTGVDPTSQGGGGGSGLGEDQDTDRDMTDAEHDARYGKKSWFGSGRTDQQKTNVSIDKGDGTYGRTSSAIEGTRGTGTTFGADANGETSGQALNDEDLSVRRGLRDMTTDEYNKKYGKDSWWGSLFRSSDQRSNRKVDKANRTYGKTQIEEPIDSDEIGRLVTQDMNKTNGNSFTDDNGDSLFGYPKEVPGRTESNDSGYNDGLEFTQVPDLKYGELQGKLEKVQAALARDLGNKQLEAIESHIKSRINSEINFNSGTVGEPTSNDDDEDDMFATSGFSNPFGAPPEEANTFSAQADSNAKRKGINRRNAMRSPNARQRVETDSAGNKIFESPSELGLGGDDIANDPGNSGDEFEGNNSKR